MSVYHLGFQISTKETTTYLGGLPHLDTSTIWPLCPSTGQPQLHLMTLGPDFFFIPTINAGYSLSVFVSFDYEQRGNNIALPREFAINDTQQVNKVKQGFCQVLLHKTGLLPAAAPSPNYLPLPKCSIDKSPFSLQELKEETTIPGSGLDVSKFGGIPGWLQDDISLGPKFSYLLQVSEYDIRLLSPEHEGLFRGGLGYLYLNRNIRKLTETYEAGHFFVQFT
jgi:hypothetical protein